MKKIVSILGARPNFIKASPLSRELKKIGFDEIIVHTGQHFSPNMSDVFFQELKIPDPSFHLDIHSLTHGAMTGRMLEKIEEVLVKVKPYFVVVYGDTNSTLAGALAAVKCHIPIVHIEAGLRSFNTDMPEESNRVLTDHISKIRFCPSSESIRNLEFEGLHYNNYLFGDLMYDTFLQYKDVALNRNFLLDKVKQKEYALVTVHREENTKDANRLYNILSAISSLAYTFVLPIHPRTEKILREHDIFNSLLQRGNILVIPPVSYLDMLCLELNSKMIITDSGGVQREAYYANVQSLLLRDETEWVELVENGYTTIVGSHSQDQIVRGFYSIMLSNVKFQNGLYGDGTTANSIAITLKRMWE